MTWRERLIIWADDKPWMGRLYVAGATLRDKRLAKTEFDKIEGSGLGTIRRKDGSVLATPCARAPQRASARPTIEIPLDRGD